MDESLAAFLARHAAVAQEETAWADGAMPLRVHAYLTAEAPPDRYVTSVRCLILRGDSVLVMRNEDDTHILPGGRRESGESSEAALRREILEETGLEIKSPALIGFLHFHHLGPMPPGYAYPYPDFIQMVYTAESAVDVPTDRLPDPDAYETDASFQSIDQVRHRRLGHANAQYVEAALARRGA